MRKFNLSSPKDSDVAKNFQQEQDVINSKYILWIMVMKPKIQSGTLRLNPSTTDKNLGGVEYTPKSPPFLSSHHLIVQIIISRLYVLRWETFHECPRGIHVSTSGKIHVYANSIINPWNSLFRCSITRLKSRWSFVCDTYKLNKFVKTNLNAMQITVDTVFIHVLIINFFFFIKFTLKNYWMEKTKNKSNTVQNIVYLSVRMRGKFFKQN